MSKNDFDEKIVDLMTEMYKEETSVEVCQRMILGTCMFAEHQGVPVEIWESCLVSFVKTTAKAIRMKEASLDKIDEICKDIGGKENANQE